MKNLYYILIIPFLIFTSSYNLFSQPITEGLVAYYSFDDCDAIDLSGNGSDGAIIGTPDCVCGVSGNALDFDGIGDHIIFLGLVNNAFDTDPFTISFYIKPYGQTQLQEVLTKRESCAAANSLSISYAPPFSLLSAELKEDDSKQNICDGQFNSNSCWQHVCLVRKAGILSLYLNAELVSESTAVSRIDLGSSAPLSIGDTPCLNTNLKRYKGLFDELIVYNRDLSANEVKELYFKPDRVLTRDTLVYLGSSLSTLANTSCNTNSEWIPSDGVDDVFAANTTITPTQSTTYTLNTFDIYGCVAQDTLQVTVIDPSTLDCEEIFIPKAFTPNGSGPQSNETVGISNPFIIDEINSFEIFDRWGGRVFHTDNPFERWDGNFNGKTANPGVFLYKIKYTCQGEEKTKFGSIMLVR